MLEVSNTTWFVTDDPEDIDDSFWKTTILHVVDQQFENEKGELNIEAIESWIAENFPARRCQHDYDCCAYLYPRKPHWAVIVPHQFIAVTQLWVRNI